MTETNETILPFGAISIEDLRRMDSGQLDALPYGVIGLTPEGVVELYNATESRMAGMPVQAVLGQHFFLSIAQCMNNFLVAQRFTDEPELDVVVPYILTFRMRPTPVTLRLLKAPEQTCSYLLIQR